MELLTEHPLDIDLLEHHSSSADGKAELGVADHLEACLLCRIRIARIRWHNIEPADAPMWGALPEVSQKVLAAVNSDHRPDSISPGQVWLADSDRRVLVWVRTALDTAVIAHAMALDVEAADETTLIVDELEAIGYPVAIWASVVGTVPNEQLTIYLGDLDIQPELERIAGPASSSHAAGLTTGAPITTETDERIVFRQMLADELAALDPVEDDD